MVFNREYFLAFFNLEDTLQLKPLKLSQRQLLVCIANLKVTVADMNLFLSLLNSLYQLKLEVRHVIVNTQILLESFVFLWDKTRFN
jgi:hypothetical protein